MITLLIDPARFHGDTWEVTGEPYQHLFRARRGAIGDAVRVVDGAGRARWSSVEAVEGRRAVLRLGEPAPVNEPERAVHLLVTVPRPQRASWMVEKVTELGVNSIAFLHSERAPRDANLKRLQRVAAAALEQCHRSRLPELSGPHEFDQIPGLAEVWGSHLVLDTAAVGGTLENSAGDDVAVVIGPEGGWSDTERRQFDEWAFTAVSLGSRVLRVETAAVAAVARLLP